MHLKKDKTSKLCVGITYKQRNFIIHPKYFNANNIFSHLFIQNIKHKPNMVHDLSRQMKIELKIYILDNSVEHQIYQIQRITGSNGRIEYR